MSRKRIGVILSNPETIYQQRLMDGIFAQCHKYDYDVVIFCTLVMSCHFDKKYLDSELNIFELINFENLDGIIVDTISLSEDKTVWIREYIADKLKKECTKPVVSLDLPLGDFPTVYTDDIYAFQVITSHIIDVHKCKKIYFLTGMKDYTVAENRLLGFRNEMEKRNLPVNDSNVFYGDFWYTSGENLADQIAAGEVEMPEAIICASDHMAIGLANRLVKHGIKIPEQIIITGYDATSEAAINTPTITTYVPDVAKSTAEAVNFLRKAIEPDKEILPALHTADNGMRLCSSCGCPENLMYIKKRLNDSIFNINHNFNDNNMQDKVDISLLLDSYMYENFTASSDIEDCMWKIYGSDYLIRPYGDFYLCLTENWINADDMTEKGYPPVMNNVIHTVPTNTFEAPSEKQHLSLDSTHIFDTKLMLPQLYDDRDVPSVFYFAPVHFANHTLGYSVLRCDLTQEHKIGCVYKNWLRNVNNALETVRIRYQLLKFSHRDVMTGLYNRRGMDDMLKKFNEKASLADNWLIFVIDMDGLKFINDNYGHSEGDYGITSIALAAQQICRSNEICVRAGGDEFYIVGLGDYSMVDALVRIENFNQLIEETNKTSGKPYKLSASIGYCCEPYSSGINFHEAVHIADGRMYENKVARKKQRNH